MKRDVRDTRRLPPEVRERFERAGVDVPGVDYRDERGRMFVVEARANTGVEVRAASDGGTLPLTGYATRYGYTYPVMGGKDSMLGWDETISKGACAKSIGEQDDVRLMFNHDGPPFARTKSGTMTLSSDDEGLLVQAELDTRDSQVRDMAVRLERGDLDQMSFAFQVTRQEWNEDYTERFITECKLFDVSVVTYPANDSTSVGVGDEAPPADPVEAVMSSDDGQREAEVVELEVRRGFALVDAQALIALAR